MNENTPYFLSAFDPNNKLKGSRDPLGFQSIWANAGRRVIKYLTTVSINIRDFQTLLYAHLVKQDHKLDDTQFMNFFLKYEQACAFARYNNDKLRSEGFNGIDYVSKNHEKQPITVSSRNNIILSNQRLYGIIGKYSSPIRNCGIISHTSNYSEIFKNAIEEKLTPNGRLIIYKDFLEKLLNKDIKEPEITNDELLTLGQLLKELTEDEKNLFTNRLLDSEDTSQPQHHLYNLLNKHADLLNIDQLRILIPQIKAYNSDPCLDRELDNIEVTDKILYIYNRYFEHICLKNRAVEEPAQDNIFKNPIPLFQYQGNDQEVIELNNNLSLPPDQFVEQLINRHKEISRRKQAGPWVSIIDGVITVHLKDYSREWHEIDYTNKNEFPYFLNTYIRLYKQINNI